MAVLSRKLTVVIVVVLYKVFSGYQPYHFGAEVQCFGGPCLHHQGMMWRVNTLDDIHHQGPTFKDSYWHTKYGRQSQAQTHLCTIRFMLLYLQCHEWPIWWCLSYLNVASFLLWICFVIWSKVDLSASCPVYILLNLAEDLSNPALSGCC